MDQQTRELIEAVTGWHVSRMQNLQTILDAPKGTDLRFQLGDGQEFVIPGDSDKAKGFLIGIMIAREQFAQLPFTVTKPATLADHVHTGSSNPAVKELADKLNMTEYPCRPSEELIEFAKANGLVIVYGASDDLIEFNGAFRDEGSVYDGYTVLVDAKGLLAEDPADLDTEQERADYYYRKPKAKSIEALWCEEGDYSWTYRTDIPHATFEIVEDGTPYCRGIVFALADLN